MAPVSYLIVPGSFATPALYDDLVALLHKQGHNVRAISLPSANDGTRLPAPTAADDAAHIREELTALLDHETTPSDVLLLLHSYAGVPGSSAVQGLGRSDRALQAKATAVVGIVYLASFLLPLGMSNRRFLITHKAMPDDVAAGVAGGYLPPIDPAFAPFLFNDVPDEAERARLLGLMTQHSSDSYDGAVAYEAFKHIPSVSIIPGNDLIVPTRLQELMYEAVATDGNVSRVFVEGAGHCLNNSRPDIVAAEMVKLAESQAVHDT
ncbi:Alpha/beta hydrolase fold-1 [Mycena maculata]|uniref:Alpha/beta hydrolase fold-1 n=1 Tax=Mycena maculata TaxID=230809 RepID=A0AAD7JN74_9AGAR|nr:Alpha/beta hydrolase fold-1 [Mycena maculata]